MRIARILETETERTIECCLADKCEDSEEHKTAYHRSWTWGAEVVIDEKTGEQKIEFPMSLEAMAREALLLAREEKRRMERSSGKELSKTKLSSLNKKLLAELT